MGLSGRKVKQRIGADPRNLTWADDASKFGATYLAKFGWTSSQGLGASGEGRKSHIKVSQKLDMLGIGAAQSRDPNGIAWKQNRDFENLLERLNANNNVQSQSDEATAEPEEKKEEEKDQKEQKQRKKEGKKRKREEGKDKDENKKKKRKSSSDKEDEEGITTTRPPPAPKSTSVSVFPRHRAHRARHIAAKSFASKSASAISEILGISSTTTSSATTTVATPTGSLTPIELEPALEKLTTSTKSVSDYFKERLLAKTSGASTSSIPAVIPTQEDLQGGRLGSSRCIHAGSDDDDDEDSTRGGLGANRAQLSISDSGPMFRIGTSKFASMFAASSPSTDETQGSEGEKLERRESKRNRKNKSRQKQMKNDEAEKDTSEDVHVAKEERKRKKEQRRRAKEEKERKELLEEQM